MSEEKQEAIRPPTKKDASPKKHVKLRHMIEDGSYHYKGLTWSSPNGQLHPVDGENPLSEKDVSYLLSLKFTTPDKRRTLIDRFKLVE